MSAPTISAPPPFTHPLCTPPLVARTPFPRPHPFRANGDANGVVRSLLPLFRGPPPPLFPPRPRPPPTPPARPPFAPLPGLHPTLPARPRTLGAGRTERPPSLSVPEQAPPPGLLPLPPGLRTTRHARALPHPLRECGVRNSAHPSFRSPLRPGCTPPRLHALARWGQGRQSVPPVTPRLALSCDVRSCYDPDTFHFFSHTTHYSTRAVPPMTHHDSDSLTHTLTDR